MRYFTAHQRYVCYILYEIADNDFIYCIYIRMNHVPQPQEDKLGYYCQPGTCLGAIKTHVLVSFLWLVFCRGTVVNVTLILKITVHRIQD